MPWDTLAGLLQTALPGVNIYPVPEENVSAPAIVIRPDDPWMVSDAIAYDEERYNAIALVSASDTRDGLRELHELMHTVAHVARSNGFELDEASAPLIDRTTDTPFLASSVSLIYRSCEGHTP